MRRISIGITTALAVWFGSAYAAEAQQITPTGPLSVVAGATSSTYTASIYIPTQMNFVVRLWVYKNGILQNYSSTNIPNPGTNNYNFSKLVDMSGWIPSAGNTILYVAQLLWNKTTTLAADWTVIVSGTRPSKSGYSVRSSNLALQSVDRDRRRE
jgi:hypothetical protein